jgi:uracil-DNA glycosylase
MNHSTGFDGASTAKCLHDPLLCRLRKLRIHEPHVAALSALVERIRADCHAGVPDFDPLDGGVEAECLFVLEAPGRKALSTGFVSRNNPDETAKNWFDLNVQVGIDRQRTAIWNVVPWYLGDGKRIRGATPTDVGLGSDYLLLLIEMLHNLRIVVLVGRAASRVRYDILNRFPNLKIAEVAHPSPTFINRSPLNRQVVLDGLLAVSDFLGGVPSQDSSR